jgi:hypothetical protein
MKQTRGGKIDKQDDNDRKKRHKKVNDKHKDKLDEALDETFPGSDPVSQIQPKKD